MERLLATLHATPNNRRAIGTSNDKRRFRDTKSPSPTMWVAADHARALSRSGYAPLLRAKLVSAKGQVKRSDETRAVEELKRELDNSDV
jgi:hypothetical protein